MFKIGSKYVPPTMPSPVKLGDEEKVREQLRERVFNFEWNGAKFINK